MGINNQNNKIIIIKAARAVYNFKTDKIYGSNPSHNENLLHF